MKCREITDFLDTVSPKKYASNWDNVGLLVGRREKEVNKIMVALDASVKVVDMAVSMNVDMLVTHHPMIFSSYKKVNEDNPTTDKILTLAENKIAYYAMHTNFDTVGGMGELAAGPDYLDLSDTEPLIYETDEKEGMGRGGKLIKPMTAREVSEYVKEKFGLDFVMLYQNEKDKDKRYDRLAVLPGAGKSEINEIKKLGYELYLTGDYGHHAGIDACDMDMTVIDATHYGLERIFISFIEKKLKEKFKDTEIIAVDTGCPFEII